MARFRFVKRISARAVLLAQVALIAAHYRGIGFFYSSL